MPDQPSPDPTGAFDLSRTFVHLGPGSTATLLPDFEWSQVEAYRDRFAGDGADGRLVCIVAQDATWDGWERHPGGEELVVLLSGRVDLVQEIGGESRTVELRELISLLERELGRDALIDRQPLQPGDVPQTFADISKARRLLRYDPQTPIEEGIRRFVEWFKESDE